MPSTGMPFTSCGPWSARARQTTKMRAAGVMGPPQEGQHYDATGRRPPDFRSRQAVYLLVILQGRFALSRRPRLCRHMSGMERGQGLVAKHSEQQLLRLAVGAALAGEGDQLLREPVAQRAVALNAVGGELAPHVVHNQVERR